MILGTILNFAWEKWLKYYCPPKNEVNLMNVHCFLQCKICMKILDICYFSEASHNTCVLCLMSPRSRL